MFLGSVKDLHKSLFFHHLYTSSCIPGSFPASYMFPSFLMTWDFPNDQGPIQYITLFHRLRDPCSNSIAQFIQHTWYINIRSSSFICLICLIVVLCWYIYTRTLPCVLLVVHGLSLYWFLATGAREVSVSFRWSLCYCVTDPRRSKRCRW